MQEQLNAYKALYETAKQHKEHLDYGEIERIEERLLKYNLCVTFNMSLQEAGYNWYEKLLGYGCKADVRLYSEEQNHQISWSDDGCQPENEWLCVISFSSGAYTLGDYFGGKYPKETFGKMFEELKSFGTKYCDTNNSALYYTTANAYVVCEAFPAIFKKYKDMCQQEYERNRVKELEAELAKLKGN